MARKTGREVSGWVIVDKPAGVTSTFVVSQVRRAFNARKAGHAGTLDPAATGVLAVALGEATKTVPYVTGGEKEYRFAVRLGAATTTDDAEGEVIATSEIRPGDAAVAEALVPLRGDIMQVPPQFSAVKVEGERAYDLARSGTVSELAARPLRVARLDLVERPDPDTLVLDMVCGKGGYVRSIARDLGQALGCLGHALWLRRMRTGPFGLSVAAPLAAIVDRGALSDRFLLPLEAGLSALPRAEAAADAADRLRHGNPAAVEASPEIQPGAEVWVSHAGRPVAIGHMTGGILHPVRVFVLPEDQTESPAFRPSWNA